MSCCHYFEVGLFLFLQGLPSNLTLTVDLDCHPGFITKTASGVCTCNTGHNDILRCDDDNRYIYLRVSCYTLSFVYTLAIERQWFVKNIQHFDVLEF